MYLWRTDRLVAELRDNTLKEADFKNYYLVTSIMILLGLYLAMIALPEDLAMMLVEAGGVIAITVWGLNQAFKANGGNAGADFVSKATAISFPLLIKIVLFSLVAGMAVSTLMEAAGDEPAYAWFLPVMTFTIQIWFFRRLSLHLHNARRETANHQTISGFTLTMMHAE